MNAPRPRGPRTDLETRILETAERLFGQRGFDGVSMREIGLAAGSSNNFAVQYHFKDKEGLAKAVYRRRLPALEVRRAELLADAGRGGDAEVEALVRVILLPIAETVDEVGQRTYAAFLMRTVVEGRAFRREVTDAAPFTAHVESLLEDALPHLPHAVFKARFSLASMMFLNALMLRDQDRIDSLAQLPEPVFLADMLAMVTASLQAPLPAVDG